MVGFHFPLFQDHVVAGALIDLNWLCWFNKAVTTKEKVSVISEEGREAVEKVRQLCSLPPIPLGTNVLAATINEAENYLWDKELASLKPVA